MRKVYFFFLSALLLFYGRSINAQSVTQAWFTSYGTANYDQFTSVATDGSGNVYITGSENASTWTGRIALVKYNSAGAMQWLVRYNGPFTGTMAKAMAVDNSGNVYIAGKATNGSQASLVVVKYNTNGQQVWANSFDSSAALLEDPSAIKVDAAGNVYVGGTINSELYNYDLLVIKYNASGVRQWVNTFNGTGNASDFFSGLTVDPSGNVYVTGMVYMTFARVINSYDYITIKYSNSGQRQWYVRYSNLKGGYDRPTGIASDASGNVYVTGYSAVSDGHYDYATVKYNTSGVAEWVARYAGSAGLDDYASGIVVDGSGNVYVTGQTSYSSSGRQIATVKYNATGAQQWVGYYWGGNSTISNAIALDRSGNIYVTGEVSTIGVTNPDAITVKYSPLGVQAWAVRYNNYWNGSDAGKALAIYQSGSIVVGTQPSVYIGGSTNTGTGDDLLLIKYTQQLVIGRASQLETLSTGAEPSNFSLMMTPNPSRGPAYIRYNVPYNSQISLKVYDVLGKEVTTLVNGSRSAGQYQAMFNTSQLTGQLYFYTLVATSEHGNYKETKPMVIGR